MILDQAEQKGTGTWTANDALGLGVPLTGITEAVFARGLSALRDERKKALTTLSGPAPGQGANRDDLIEDSRLASVLVRFHDNALRRTYDAPSPLLETEAAVITSAGNAAAAPAASVAAEIGSIAQFTGLA